MSSFANSSFFSTQRRLHFIIINLIIIYSLYTYCILLNELLYLNCISLTQHFLLLFVLSFFWQTHLSFRHFLLAHVFNLCLLILRTFPISEGTGTVRMSISDIKPILIELMIK